MSTRIVIVDDSAIDRRLVEFFLKRGIADVSLLSVDSGQKALDAIASDIPDAIITDLQMPGMNGLEFVEQIKARGYPVPVILMTGSGTQQIALQSLRTGAASYLPKSGLDKHLIATVKHVLSVSRWQQNRCRSLSTLDVVESHFTLKNDALLIPPLIAYLQEQLETMQIFDHLEITRIGIAVYESLTNAIYHGNLELDEELRQSDEALFFRIAAERLQEESYSSRRVRLLSRLSGAELWFVVAYDGSGDKLLGRKIQTNDFSPNMESIEGRGMLLIRSVMDEVTHNSQGNEITMVKRMQAQNSDLSSAVTKTAS